MLLAKNYNGAFEFVKVMYKLLYFYKLLFSKLCILFGAMDL